MKSLLLATAVVVASLGAYAQGTVALNNSSGAVGGAGAKVTDFITGIGVDAGFVAQLWAGPTADSLAPIGVALAFRSSPAAGLGFINTSGGVDISRKIDTVKPGEVAQCQLVAWEIAKGATYAEAEAAGGKVGKSNVFGVATGGAGDPPGLPTNLVGLQAFTVKAVPEPTTIALGALGLGALLWRRRS